MKQMRKILLRLTLISLPLLVTQSLFGQDDETTGSKFGLGVTLFNLSEYSFDNQFEPINSIYMTIDIGKKFRLEPTIGFAISEGFEQYSVGVGAFGVKPMSQFKLLYGLRLAYGNAETFAVAPTVGGEYYFVKNFSIGSEVQLRGLFNDGDWVVFSNASVLVRFYF
jgi:hypothetical protein